ncbi:MAG TPA: hypothetical protein VHZ78_03625, partial [Rhizomicrobium sp.]|nr:hypothetical protein [Rhizomicrobium sp.]
RPVAGVKSRGSIRAAMVTTKPGRQGEHEGNRKTIVQGMPVETGEPVALPGHFLPKPRVHRTPGIPCALIFEDRKRPLFLRVACASDGGGVLLATLAWMTRRDRGGMSGI